MTTVNSKDLISSEVWVISKTSSGWVVEENRALVLDVLTSTKENCRMALIKKANETVMVKDNIIFTKKESALKEVEFLNNDKFEDVINYSKDFDWIFNKGYSCKQDSISKKFNNIKISINRNGTIKMNEELFKSHATIDFIKKFIDFVK